MLQKAVVVLSGFSLCILIESRYFNAICFIASSCNFRIEHLPVSFLPDENCKDKYYNCNVVVQARLCVYTYYKTACCASCLRVANRQSGFLGRR